MLKKALATVAVTAAATGVLMTGAAAAYAGGPETSGNGSVLGGNQVIADVNVPVNVCGNSIAILGIAGSSCHNSGAGVIKTPWHYGW
ncbi:chaplin [Nocardiopsis ansamitocini]|uniref:Chaplin domain-containing protein n=1 Tax=Nocardiopsis ansamitocini TaxID=1670832 RepID=A0A9W6P4S9_9ACTN|nr:chaplin [Nocardiopsis ansamitocini]GLU47354.1 hypothetical protein Nans01_17050 [Nocardiopsis ansamitocini]